MTKVLWFSRHDMKPEQVAALGNSIEVTKVNCAQLPNVHVPFEAEKDNSGKTVQFPPFKELLKDFDVLCVVLPINLQQQVLGVAGNRPMLVAVNRRELIPVEGGEDKVVFNFDRWDHVKEIKVVTQPWEL